MAVALREPHPSDAEPLAQLGVDEVVLVATPPEIPGQAAGWIAELARDWQ